MPSLHEEINSTSWFTTLTLVANLILLSTNPTWKNRDLAKNVVNFEFGKINWFRKASLT